MDWEATQKEKKFISICWQELKNKNNSKSSEVWWTAAIKVTSNRCGDLPKDGEVLLSKSGRNQANGDEKCVGTL